MNKKSNENPTSLVSRIENKDIIQSYIITTAKYDFSVYEKSYLPNSGNVIDLIARKKIRQSIFSREGFV